jgi:hypothetical protein
MQVGIDQLDEYVTIRYRTMTFYESQNKNNTFTAGAFQHAAFNTACVS